MASNRERKLKLYAQNPNCHWCGRETHLTSVTEIKGQPDPLMATVDHLISRYHVERFVKAKPGEQRQVLACFECNNRRAKEEAQRIPKHILSKMGQGFCLAPHKKNIFHRTVDTIEEALARLQANGIEIFSISTE